MFQLLLILLLLLSVLWFSTNLAQTERFSNQTIPYTSVPYASNTIQFPIVCHTTPHCYPHQIMAPMINDKLPIISQFNVPFTSKEYLQCDIDSHHVSRCKVKTRH